MPAGAVKRPVHLARTGRRDVQRDTLPISLSFPDRVFEAAHFDVVGGSGWILRRLSSLIAQATLDPEHRLADLRQVVSHQRQTSTTRDEPGLQSPGSSSPFPGPLKSSVKADRVPHPTVSSLE